MMEEEMPAIDGTPKPNSGAGWTCPPLAFLGASAFGRSHMTEQTAQASLMALDMVDSWLTASRQMIDLWRTTARQLQDGMLASYRQQIVNALAHDLLEEMEVPKQTPAKRAPLTKTAVARTAAAPAA